MNETAEKIYTEDTFDPATAQIGELVEEKVVDNYMNVLPPASMSMACAQLGEPYSHKEDEKTGRLRPTYLTFRRVRRGVWEYRGKCFRGETEERGKEPCYV